MNLRDEVEQTYTKMAAVLKECESENFSIEHYAITEEEKRRCEMIDRIHHRREYLGLKVGTYVVLKRKVGFNEVVMSDTFMERESNFDFVKNARGDVLIGGLGIGMVLLAIQDKLEVTSVTVVEIEPEIINLVKPQLPLNQKVTIVQGDIFAYTPTQKFDTIYFDIWDNICSDQWENIKKLQNRFKWKLRKGGWMSCWRKEDFRNEARRA
jgi:spermidine synthase